MERIKGQVLSEAIVAMGIITIGVLGMAGFLSRAISEGRYIADQTTAVNLAAEGIEIAKNILDGNALKDNVPWNYGFNEEGFYEVDFESSSLGAPLGKTENQGDLRNLKVKKIGDSEFYSYSGDTDTTFKRSVQIEYVLNRAYQIRVTSKVYWAARGNRLNNVSLSSDMYYWR
ncbi:MAG: hypothetical protein WC565_03685 [Parcubacteria group bacterium]